MTELQSKTLDRYSEKSGDWLLALMDTNNSMMYEAPEDDTWAQYYVSDDILFIEGAYCEKNIDRHLNILKSIGRDHGCGRLQFTTDRNPKAFERRFGAKTILYKMEYKV
jgi:hypothetical protein